VLERHGVDASRPYVIFVGRITRQKGVPVLLRATSRLVPQAQLVLCAGQADTPELEAEVTGLVEGLRASRSGVLWIPEMLPKREVIQLLTHATVFACPSVYEPLGIVNLEAMACGTAVVAVSDGMRADIATAYPEISAERIRVIRNGIDTTEYQPDPATDVLERHGIDLGRPYVIFVGRITRQKGVPVLLRAASGLVAEAQLVLCAGQPDTPELGAEVTELVDGLRASRSGVIWIPEMLPKPEVIQLLSHATVFACPSIYEPLGIVNLEAMACGTAVVASRTGGIPEVVADGQTGLLVPPGEPEALAGGLNALIRDPDRAAAMGQAGRKRAVAEFGWPAIAAQTVALYSELVSSA